MKNFKKPTAHADNHANPVASKTAEIPAALRSLKTSSFNKSFDSLPKEIQDLAVKNFMAWKNDHNAINMKPLAFSGSDVWSAEVNFRYRALGVKGLDKDHKTTYVWFWIGSHEDYNKLTARKENVATNITNIRRKYLTGARESRESREHKTISRPGM